MDKNVCKCCGVDNCGVDIRAVWYDAVMKKRERATKQLRIYPSSYEKLRTLAYKRRKSMPAVINEVLGGV
jgi:hypothetical protein